MSEKTHRFANRRLVRFILIAVAAVCFVLFAISRPDYVFPEHYFQSAVFLGAVYFFALVLLEADKRIDTVSDLAALAVVIAGLMFVRFCMFYYKSQDYIEALYFWVERMQEKTLKEAFEAGIGNYNLPCLYLLYLIANLPGVDDLAAIKAFSCLFDVLLAFYVMKIVSMGKKDYRISAAAFVLTMALPTVILNGAYWGQCDSVYTAFCVASFYHGLRGEGRACTILWTLAFSFKLQAIFALPILVVLFFDGKINRKSLFFIPVVLFLTILPALLCGRPLSACLEIYSNQAEDYASMSLNTYNIWTLLGNVEFRPFDKIAVFLCGTAIVFFLYLTGCFRKNLDTKIEVQAFACITLLVPFLLPRMHDRYFFIADAASLLYFFFDKKKWFVPVLVNLASYSSYRYYIMGATDTEILKYYTVAILFTLTFMLKDYFSALKQSGNGQM